MNNKRLVITSFARTPLDSQKGREFIEMAIPEMAVVAAKAAIERSNLGRSEVESFILGQVDSSTGEAGNLARHVALKCGLDYETALGFTVNRVCGSGFQAVASSMMEIWCDNATVCVAGGAEMCSHTLMALPLSVAWLGLRPGMQLGARNYEGDACAPNEIYGYLYGPGATVENIGRKYKIPREDADLFAYQSQMKMKAAQESGRFDCEIVPFEVRHTDRKGRVEKVVYDKDLHPKPYTTLEGLAALKPAFEPPDGTITAGNASGSNSGAAAMVIMPEEEALRRGLTPIAYLNAFAFGGVDPRLMGMGPVPAINRLLAKTNLKLEDINVLEINEAFATQVLGCLVELGNYIGTPLYERLNPNGGAIAIGHPPGCTGSRIIGSVANELRITGKKYGIASACIGGGQGVAVLIEHYGE